MWKIVSIISDYKNKKYIYQLFIENTNMISNWLFWALSFMYKQPNEQTIQVS